MRYGLARIYLQTNRTAEGEKMLKIYQELIRQRQVRESHVPASTDRAA